MPSPSPASPGPCQRAAATPRRWGTKGTPGTPGAVPMASPAPQRCARRPRRDAPGVPAPFPSLLSGPRRPRSSPGQGQLFGAAVLRGVVLPRRRRRWRGLGGRGSARGFGRHDALRGPARAGEGGARGGGRARTPGTPRPHPTPVTKIMGTSPEENRTRPATERPGQPRENVTSARGVTSARLAGRGRQWGTGAAVAAAAGEGEGAGGKPRGSRACPGLSPPASSPWAAPAEAGRARSEEPRPLGERWTGRAPRPARPAGKTKTNVPGQWEVGSAGVGGPGWGH